MVFLDFYGNKFVGNIDKFITDKFYKDNHKLYRVTIQDQREHYIYSVFKYKTAFPLILDEVKNLFKGIPSLNYIKVSIKDNPENENSPETEYLMCRHLPCKPLTEYKYPTNLSIQLTFAFYWLMCIPETFESKIFVFPNNMDNIYINNDRFSQMNEQNFILKDKRCEPSEHIIDKWFEGKRENFDLTLQILLNDVDPNLLRIQMLKIVKKYDEKYITWVTQVLAKVLPLTETRITNKRFIF
jgi:hypothetical protein